MKLSLAIRLGAMMLPKSDSYLEGFPPAACCAVGGAALAVGYRQGKDGTLHIFASDRWPILKTIVRHPIEKRDGPLENIINGLNYSHCFGWTRERIADWIATIEPQDVPVEIAEVCQEVAG